MALRRQWICSRQYVGIVSVVGSGSLYVHIAFVVYSGSYDESHKRNVTEQVSLLGWEGVGVLRGGGGGGGRSELVHPWANSLFVRTLNCIALRSNIITVSSVVFWPQFFMLQSRLSRLIAFTLQRQFGHTTLKYVPLAREATLGRSNRSYVVLLHSSNTLEHTPKGNLVHPVSIFL